jgi:hypothetical protein
MSLCISPSESSHSVQCQNLKVAGSNHCQYHAPLVKHSWKEYKRLEDCVLVLSNSVETNTIEQNLVLHTNISVALKKRNEHAKNFIMKQFWDDGHQEWMDFESQLVEKVYLKLTKQFSNKGCKEEPKSEPQFEPPQAKKPRIQKKSKKTKKEIAKKKQKRDYEIFLETQKQIEKEKLEWEEFSKRTQVINDIINAFCEDFYQRIKDLSIQRCKILMKPYVEASKQVAMEQGLLDAEEGTLTQNQLVLLESFFTTPRTIMEFFIISPSKIVQTGKNRAYGKYDVETVARIRQPLWCMYFSIWYEFWKFSQIYQNQENVKLIGVSHITKGIKCLKFSNFSRLSSKRFRTEN